MGNSEIFTKIRSKMTWPDRACFAKVAVSPKKAKRREATTREDELITPKKSKKRSKVHGVT